MVNHCMVSPLEKYCSIFPMCVSHIKAREKALQDYAKIHSRLEKYKDREDTASNSVRVEGVGAVAV